MTAGDPPPPASTRRGRTAQSGPGRGAARPGAALTLAFAVLLGACGTQPSRSVGGPQLPAWLQKVDARDATTDHVLTGTVRRPALSFDGVAIEARTQRGSVLVDVSGPVVPGEGLPYQGLSTTCTWTVTMSGATTRIPVSLADFDSIDHLGHVYRMTPVPGQAPVPTSLAPGRRITFQMRAYELVGEGIMRWAPVDRRIVAEWDYEVEND